MAVRRSRFTPRAPGQRRQTSWFEIQLTQTAVASNAAVLVASLTTAEKAKRPFTIVRTQLSTHLTTDQLAATELQAIAVGMCVVSDQASAIGVTAIPTPDTDMASDLWFLHRWNFDEFLLASAVGFDSPTGRILHIDSKAMRKVNNDEDVVLVVETGAISSGVNFITAGRLLIKEH